MYPRPATTMRPFGSTVMQWMSLASLLSANSVTTNPGGTLSPGAAGWAQRESGKAKAASAASEIR